MTNPVQEIVLYQVTDPATFDIVRNAALDRVRHLPGWMGWHHLADVNDPAMRADLVSWRDEAAAGAAGDIVGRAVEFAPFRDAIARVEHFGHYRTIGGLAPAPAAGQGIELGRFCLREGIDPGDMREAYHAMVRDYLSQQVGWRGQFLIDLGMRHYVDVALADTQERAEAICASWQGNPLCETFLAHICDAEMAFGRIDAAMPG